MTFAAASRAVLLVTLAWPGSAPAWAADVLGPVPTDGYSEPARPAIVVPGCSDSVFRTLMTCLPREATVTPGDPALAAIEGTIVPHAKPYGEVFKSPGERDLRRR